MSDLKAQKCFLIASDFYLGFVREMVKRLVPQLEMCPRATIHGLSGPVTGHGASLHTAVKYGLNLKHIVI
jgi:hypothetical protein